MIPAFVKIIVCRKLVASTRLPLSSHKYVWTNWIKYCLRFGTTTEFDDRFGTTTEFDEFDDSSTTIRMGWNKNGFWIKKILLLRQASRLLVIVLAHTHMIKQGSLGNQQVPHNGKTSISNVPLIQPISLIRSTACTEVRYSVVQTNWNLTQRDIIEVLDSCRERLGRYWCIKLLSCSKIKLQSYY